MHSVAMMLLLWQAGACQILMSLFVEAGWKRMTSSAGAMELANRPTHMQESNRASNASCCVNATWYKFSGPPPELQGRGGALRLTRTSADFCFIAC